MSRAIEHIIVGGVLDARVILGNAQMARVLEKGNTWNTIRIGMRYVLTDSGADLTSGPRLCLGVMSEPEALVANGPLSGAATGHYIGTYHTGGGSPTWTRVAGPPVRYSPGQSYLVSKIGSSVSTLSFQNGHDHSATSEMRKIMVMQLNKSTTSSNAHYFGLDTWDSLDHSYEDLVEIMETSSVTAAGLLSAIEAATGSDYLSNSGSITVDEGTNGPLNAVVLAWDKTVSKLKISELLVSYHS